MKKRISMVFALLVFDSLPSAVNAMDHPNDYDDLTRYCAVTMEKNRPQQDAKFRVSDCAQYFLRMEEADAKYRQNKDQLQSSDPASSDKSADNLKKRCIQFLSDVSPQHAWSGSLSPEACMKFFIRANAPPVGKANDPASLRGKDGLDGNSIYGGVGGRGGRGGSGANGGEGGTGGAGSFGGHGGRGGAGGSSE